MKTHAANIITSANVEDCCITQLHESPFTQKVPAPYHSSAPCSASQILFCSRIPHNNLERWVYFAIIILISQVHAGIGRLSTLPKVPGEVSRRDRFDSGPSHSKTSALNHEVAVTQPRHVNVHTKTSSNTRACVIRIPPYLLSFHPPPPPPITSPQGRWDFFLAA